MYNELIFIGQSILIGFSALIALALGKSALIAFISVQAILANLFVVKQATFFGLEATCSDAFTIGSVLGLNLLQEYYGKKSARFAIVISLFCLVFYTVFAFIHLVYIPSTHDNAHAAFSTLLQPMARITVASLIVYCISDQCDTWFYSRLRESWQGRHLLLRTYLSIAAAQLIDTVLFTFLGLHGIVHNLVHIILISYTIKLVAAALATPFVFFSRRFFTLTQE